jgi:formylmethanofuran dehydrogenase subunit B
VATPGLDHAGHVYRCDSVVSLPLRGLRGSALPAVASVLNAITEQL